MAEVVAALRTELPPPFPAVTETSHLYEDLYVDSLDMVAIVLAIEDRLGGVLLPDDVYDARTVTELVDRTWLFLHR